MEERTRANHPIAGRETVAEGTDLRVRILTLAPGESIPWRYHSEITDDFVGMDGVTVVETQAPATTYVLKPGQRCTVGPKTRHHVHGLEGAGCRFLVIQGVGVYDWMLDAGQNPRRK